MQRDRETLDILRTTVGTGRLAGPTEVNMEATPYRANNAYYIQADLFIDFQKNEAELTRWLAKEAEDDLRAFIAGQYGFATTPIRMREAAIYDYSLEQFPGAPIETFHAKLLLVDGIRAYVGSANMTGSSFESSMELGVVLSGEAARQLSRFVEVVVRCARPWKI